MNASQILECVVDRMFLEWSKSRPMLPTYALLLISSLFPIYTGAHASLSRPTSASKPQRSSNQRIAEDEENESLQHMENLSLSDVVLFPIMAGTVLTGLYALIVYYGTDVLNMVLGAYTAFVGVGAVASLVSDGLDVLHSVLFPHDFVDRGFLWHADHRNSSVRRHGTDVSDPHRKSPLPGPLSRFPMPDLLLESLWWLARIPQRFFRFSLYVRHVVLFSADIGIHGIEGLAAGLCAVSIYMLIAKSWWLTNLMGFGFSYGALRMLSPTSFSIGTLLLGALFCYDIYMVFFTPIMVTVAQNLDIPVKLVFPRPAPSGEPPIKESFSMLGLGDIVIPGMMIGLALRFDLFLYYKRQQTQTPNENLGTDRQQLNPNQNKADKEKPERLTITKTPYRSVSEGWGDRLWTCSLFWGRDCPVDYQTRNAFPKPYFHAGLVGYTLGMVVTLLAMQISEHPQPALLWLVPAVCSSLWAKAWFRGELTEMWHFSDMEQEGQQQDGLATTDRGGDECGLWARATRFLWQDTTSSVKRVAQQKSPAADNDRRIQSSSSKDFDQHGPNSHPGSDSTPTERCGSDQLGHHEAEHNGRSNIIRDPETLIPRSVYQSRMVWGSIGLMPLGSRREVHISIPPPMLQQAGSKTQ